MDQDRLTKRYRRLSDDAKRTGYTLNPDDEFVRSLTEGLLTNMDRYGTESCPCRLFIGTKEDNLDIVCPCDYRDDDLAEHGACFCALYISENYSADRQIPDRRRSEKQKKSDTVAAPFPGTLSFPVWRCNSCGYLCALHHAPKKCPICGASKERFSRFI